MKILVDMNLSPLWADFLAGNGIEAVHWSSIGSPDAPPDKIGSTVVNAIKQLAADIERGALVTIDQHKSRVTLLPL